VDSDLAEVLEEPEKDEAEKAGDGDLERAVYAAPQGEEGQGHDGGDGPSEEQERAATFLCDRGSFTDALAASFVAVRSEPLRESAHRRVIEVHLADFA
jgi:hypothetical protein